MRDEVDVRTAFGEGVQGILEIIECLQTRWLRCPKGPVRLATLGIVLCCVSCYSTPKPDPTNAESLFGDSVEDYFWHNGRLPSTSRDIEGYWLDYPVEWRPEKGSKLSLVVLGKTLRDRSNGGELQAVKITYDRGGGRVDSQEFGLDFRPPNKLWKAYGTENTPNNLQNLLADELYSPHHPGESTDEACVQAASGDAKILEYLRSLRVVETSTSIILSDRSGKLLREYPLTGPEKVNGAVKNVIPPGQSFTCTVE